MIQHLGGFMGFSIRLTLKIVAIGGLLSGCASVSANKPDDPSRVNSNDVQLANESIEHMLERRAPGLQVIPTGDGFALQIRGNSQIDGAITPPLYILNGLPFNPGPGGLITGVSISEIDTVKVLKGAQAGMYGIDGANGVIVITTKNGTQKK
jgi:TonB-dependent starch-binding outer membrane protein SusC